MGFSFVFFFVGVEGMCLGMDTALYILGKYCVVVYPS